MVCSARACPSRWNPRKAKRPSPRPLQVSPAATKAHRGDLSSQCQVLTTQNTKDICVSTTQELHETSLWVKNKRTELCKINEKRCYAMMLFTLVIEFSHLTSHKFTSHLPQVHISPPACSHLTSRKFTSHLPQVHYGSRTRELNSFK